MLQTFLNATVCYRCVAYSRNRMSSKTQYITIIWYYGTSTPSHRNCVQYGRIPLPLVEYIFWKLYSLEKPRKRLPAVLVLSPFLNTDFLFRSRYSKHFDHRADVTVFELVRSARQEGDARENLSNDC